MKANQKFSKDEEAVSPVIGVILMVAITVILAAVIAAFVFGMGSSLKKNYLVAATASQVGTDIVVTYNGGPDHDAVKWFNITTVVSATTDDSATPTTAINNTVDPVVGYTATYSGVGTSGNDNAVIAVVEFDDGTSQVILNTFV